MNVLTDLIPANARKYVYAIVALAALVYGAWQAAGGDWKAAVASLVGAAVTALAHANTNAPETPAAPPAQ